MVSRSLILAFFNFLMFDYFRIWAWESESFDLIYSLVVPKVHWRSYKHSRMQTFILTHLVFKTLQSTRKWLVAFFPRRIIVASVERLEQSYNESPWNQTTA